MREQKPTLRLLSAPPRALAALPRYRSHRVHWSAEARYPAPLGAVYVRCSVPLDKDKSGGVLDVVSASGQRLQKLIPSFDLPTKPRLLTADYLVPSKRSGPCLRFGEGDRLLSLAFPEGFGRFCSYEVLDTEQAKALVWNGLSFDKPKSQNRPRAIATTAPLLLPEPRRGQALGMLAVLFDKPYLLRWVRVGKSLLLEVLQTGGAVLQRHEMKDTFAFQQGFSDADWLDLPRRSGPVLIARDSDVVQVHVFTDGLRKRLCSQDFNDSSSSISATTVSLDHDDKGILTVYESYSERPEEGQESTNDHTTAYTWSGSGFTEVPRK